MATDVIWAELRIDTDASKKAVQSLNTEIIKSGRETKTAAGIATAAIAKETTAIKGATDAWRKHGDESKKSSNVVDANIRRTTSELRGLNEAANKAGGSISQSFGRVGDTIKKTSAGFSGFNTGISKIQGGIGALGASLAPLAATMGIAFGVEKIISFGEQSIKSFQDSQKNAQLLLFALKGNISAQSSLIQLSSELQDKTIYSGGTIQQAETFLALQGRTPAQIEKVIRAATELSTLTG